MRCLPVLAIACASERPRAVDIAREPARPVETIDASLLPPSTRAAPGAEACLMLYECGCNAGCTKVERPADGLSPGMQVKVTSGPLKGTSVFVAKQTTESGERVLTIQRDDPNAGIHICGVPRASFIGYLCASAGSGAARACHTCA